MSSGQGYNTGDRQATVTTGSTTRYTIPSLTNGTEYTVRVIATRTGANDGPPSVGCAGDAESAAASAAEHPAGEVAIPLADQAATVDVPVSRTWSRRTRSRTRTGTG